jgi:hypothetical protein
MPFHGVSLSHVIAFEFPGCVLRTYFPLPCNNVFLPAKFPYKSHPPTRKVAVGCLCSQPFVAYLFPSVCFPLAPTSSHPPREGASKKKQKHNTAPFNECDVATCNQVRDFLHEEHSKVSVDCITRAAVVLYGGRIHDLI